MKQLPKLNELNNLFLEHYLSDLYPEGSEAKNSEVQIAQLAIEGVRNSLKTTRIDFIDSESGEMYTLKRAGEAVMRWTNAKLIEGLRELGLTYPQIEQIHHSIVGSDGNVLGHSENIYKYAVTCKLPQIAILGFYTHDIGEILLILKQLRNDYDSEMKNNDQKKEEQKALKTVLGKIGFGKDLVSELLPIAEKHHPVHVKALLRTEKNQFYKMYLYFKNLNMEKLIKIILKSKVLNGIDSKLDRSEFARKVAKLYIDYIDSVIPSIESKSYFNPLQEARDEFFKKYSVDNSIPLIQNISI
jgi:hypothetical protein